MLSDQTVIIRGVILYQIVLRHQWLQSSFFQNEEIFIQLDELDRITQA